MQYQPAIEEITAKPRSIKFKQIKVEMIYKLIYAKLE